MYHIYWYFSPFYTFLTKMSTLQRQTSEDIYDTHNSKIMIKVGNKYNSPNLSNHKEITVYDCSVTKHTTHLE